MNSDLTTGDLAIGALLRQAHVRASTTFAKALEPLGIAGRHFAVLHTLAGRSPMSQRELIDAIGSDKASMVRIVDDLETAGLAVRQADPGDRRVRAVVITAKGRETLAEADRTAHGVASGLLAHMDPAARKQLTKLLADFVSG